MKKLANLIVKKYRAILAASMILLVIAGLTAQNIGMDSKMDNMLPENSESIKAGDEYGKYFDSQDTVLVVIKGEGNEAEKYMDSLSTRLYGDKIANNVLYRMEMESIKDYLHLYVDTQKYKNLEAELDNPESPLSGFLKNKDFTSFSSLFIKTLNEAPREDKGKLLSTFVKLIKGDTLKEDDMKYMMSFLIFGKIDEEAEGSEYLLSDSRDTYLMIIKPNINMEDFVAEREKFFKSLDRALKEVKSEGNYKVEAGITGGALVQDYEADTTMFNDFYSTAVLTFVVIILFILLSFKKIIIPLASGYPLLLGAVLSTAAAYIFYRNLNMFSISFAVLLLGLGIDFAVHIISRYLEERAAGIDVKTSVFNALNETGVGMIIGALTTSIAFFAFLAADFKAFTQMGVISGAGIMILCITMIFIMPSIIMLIDSRRKSPKKIPDSEYKFLKPVGRVIERKPLIFIVLVLTLAAAATSNVLSLNIETDMSKIYPQNMESIKWLKVVEDEFNYNPTTLQFMVDDMDELEKCVKELSQRKDVKEIESILKYMPEDQDYKIGVIKKFNSAAAQPAYNHQQPDPAEVFESFNSLIESAERNNINKSSEEYRTLEHIVNGLKGQNAVGILKGLAESELSIKEKELTGLAIKGEELTPEKLPQSLRSNFLGKDGKLSVEISPSVNIWREENFTSLKDAIKAVSGHYPVGMPAIMNEVTGYVRNDILKISIFCLLILLIILLAMFRNIKDAVITLIPLILSIYVTLGIMPLLGVELNIFSIISFPVLLGIGIDSGVHLMHRIKSSPDRGIDYILSHTGKAIVMTVLTTLIGFGSLYYTNHPGLASFGLTTVIGMSTCMLVTLTVLPALYTVFYRK